MVSFIESGAAKAGKPLKMRDTEANKANTNFFTVSLLSSTLDRIQIYKVFRGISCINIASLVESCHGRKGNILVQKRFTTCR